MKTVTLSYKTASGFTRHIKCTESNPKNFVQGQKYIVLTDPDPKVKVVESAYRAEKLNNSILNENWIRRVLE